MDVAVDFARKSLLRYTTVGFQVMGTVTFQAMGLNKPAMILSLSRQLLFIFPILFGLAGLFSSSPLADLAAALLTLQLYKNPRTAQVRSNGGIIMSTYPVSDLLTKRHSVRRYRQEPVADELIESCLEAARRAPSACNAQPWFFHVCRSPEMRDVVSHAMNSGIYGKGVNGFVTQAPVIIVTEIRRRTKATTWLGGLIRNVSYEPMDVAIAMDHLTLQAAELGLGTCWIGWFNEDAVRKVLKLPGSIRLVAMTLGWPEAPQTPSRRKKIEAIRRFL